MALEQEPSLVPELVLGQVRVGHSLQGHLRRQVLVHHQDRDRELEQEQVLVLAQELAQILALAAPPAPRIGVGLTYVAVSANALARNPVAINIGVSPRLLVFAVGVV